MMNHPRWFTKFDTTICCWVVAVGTLCDLMNLTLDLLTLDSGHTWLVTWSMTYEMSATGNQWQCVCSHCACAISRDLCIWRNFSPHIWNVYSPCNFYGSTTKINPIICQNSVLPCVTEHRADCACAKSRYLLTVPKRVAGIILNNVWRNISTHIWNHWPGFVYSLCNFYGSMINTNPAIHQNSVLLCVTTHKADCTSAKSVC